MSIAKIIEVSAQSGQSWEDAAQQAVTAASKTVRNIRSIWVKEMEAMVEGDRISAYRVVVKITFVLEGR